MFKKLGLLCILQLLLGIQAQAAIRSVRITSTPATTPSGKMQLLVVEIDAGDTAYPTVTSEVSKLSSDSALVTLKPFPAHCTEPNRIARLTVIIEDQLADLGLDPNTAKIFVQLQ